MTPTELHALVADVPEVWGPLGLLNDTWTYKSWGTHAPIDPLHAADIICGEVKRKIAETNGVGSGKFDGPNGRYYCDIEGEGVVLFSFTEMPTELEAVLAAYRASRGKQ